MTHSSDKVVYLKKIDSMKPPANEAHLSAEVQGMFQPNQMTNKEHRAAVEQSLLNSGVLPNVLVQQRDHLDTDRSGNLSVRELKTGTDDKNPVTAAAARYGLEHFQEIRNSGNWWSRMWHSSDSISQTEIQNHADNRNRT